MRRWSMDPSHENGWQQGTVFTDQRLYSTQRFFQNLRSPTEFSINIKASRVSIGFEYLPGTGYIVSQTHSDAM